MRVRFPGLVDLQVNGFAGVDFNTPRQSPEVVASALAAMRATGVTRCLPTLITSSLHDFAACAAVIAACRDPMIAGIHLEGPYISPLDGPRGVHPRAHVAPASLDDFLWRQEAAEGRIVLVTLAPEVPGALALIDALVARNIRVALGHTAASRDQIRAAIAAGATLATHLGNGCAALLPRHDNVLWEQLAADELTATLIVDGYHLPPAVVKSMVRAKGPGRTILVTDAVAAAFAPQGRYMLGETEIERDQVGRAVLPGQSQLAGAALTLDVAIGNAVRFGACTFDEAIAAASVNPARVLGFAPVGCVEADWNPESQRITIESVDAEGNAARA